VVPGSFGTFAGLATDGCARVLDASGTPIPGLYAAGTDMASVFGGFYPAGGSSRLPEALVRAIARFKGEQEGVAPVPPAPLEAVP